MSMYQKIQILQTKHANTLSEMWKEEQGPEYTLEEDLELSLLAEYKEALLDSIKANKRISAELKERGDNHFTDNNDKLWEVDQWLDAQSEGLLQVTLQNALGKV